MNRKLRPWQINLVLLALIVGSTYTLVVHRRVASPKTIDETGGMKTLVRSHETPPASDAAGSRTPKPAAGTDRPVALRLTQIKAQSEAMFSRYPALRQQMHSSQKVGAALRYSEFCSARGIIGERLDLFLDLTAEQLMAPTRGETGDQEAADIRQLLGEENYQALLSFQQIQPGLQQGDEVAAFFRERKIELGEAEQEIRQAAAVSIEGEGIIIKRLSGGTPINPGDAQSLYSQVMTSYEPLRERVLRIKGQAALAELDNWISAKINGQISIARAVSETSAKK